LTSDHTFPCNQTDRQTGRLTTDFELSIRAVMAPFRCASLAGASVKTKISEEGGAAVSASWWQGDKAVFGVIHRSSGSRKR